MSNHERSQLILQIMEGREEVGNFRGAVDKAAVYERGLQVLNDVGLEGKDFFISQGFEEVEVGSVLSPALKEMISRGVLNTDALRGMLIEAKEAHEDLKEELRVVVSNYEDLLDAYFEKYPSYEFYVEQIKPVSGKVSDLAGKIRKNFDDNFDPSEIYLDIVDFSNSKGVKIQTCEKGAVELEAFLSDYYKYNAKNPGTAKQLLNNVDFKKNSSRMIPQPYIEEAVMSLNNEDFEKTVESLKEEDGKNSRHNQDMGMN